MSRPKGKPARSKPRSGHKGRAVKRIKGAPAAPEIVPAFRTNDHAPKPTRRLDEVGRNEGDQSVTDAHPREGHGS